MFQNQYFPGQWLQMPQLTTTSSPITASQTAAPSPTIAIHVRYWSKTSASHVEDPQIIATIHVGGITPVTTSHIDVTSPSFVHHMGDDSPAFSSHTESMSPAIVNDVGGTHMIEKLRHLRHKPKFLCRNCKGNHLTRLCPATVGIPEAWFSPEDPSGSEAYVVSPHLVSPLIDTTVMLMQSYPEHTSVGEGDVSSIHVITHPIQPGVEEVFIPVQSLVNPTLLLEGDASFNHVIIISDTTHFERERFLLSLSTLPPSPREVPFYCDCLVGYPMPLPCPFM
jgi:hypothetical protein